MSNMNPDVFISVRFKTTAESGRKTAIGGRSYPSYYGCLIFIDGEAFECRLLLQRGKKLELGEIYEVPVKFLWPDMVLPMLSIGKTVTLCEGKWEVAVGKVTRFGATGKNAGWAWRDAQFIRDQLAGEEWSDLRARIGDTIRYASTGLEILMHLRWIMVELLKTKPDLPAITLALIKDYIMAANKELDYDINDMRSRPGCE